ncbi:hypothetical protein L1049_016819 [Liquidambar formosana]|uniref:Uncharacterized protein n=1 Tax=Liquidambar formosana TaxID=63359 RepID=A0AAP0RZU5_LIQFO
MMEVVKFSGRETRLEVLDAHTNRLQGRLPVNLVTLENLRSLNLGHNLFSGPIPMQYGAMLEGSWRSLFLDYNFLAGNLPPHFASSDIKGSLANNCLRCPPSIPWCHGGQRPASECAGKNTGGG